jgi:hypothetical protein
LGGYRNSWTDQQGMLQNRMDIARSSQWYLSPDIRFSRIPVRKKGMKEFFSLLDMIKIPLPGLMLQEGNIRVLPLSF